MEIVEYEMAIGCFGYGRWDAPYWFIGPEQVQGAWKNNEMTARLEAYRKLSKDGLTDCRAFHIEINEERFHGGRPAFQPTWKPLILLLKTFLGEPTDLDSMLAYQSDHWGSSTGETCVIESFGLTPNDPEPCKDREIELWEQRQIDSALRERMKFIHANMFTFEPKFVVIYGKSQVKYWMKFWKDNGVVVLLSDNIAKLGFTTVVFAQHPTSSGPGNQYWIELGQRLRQESDLS